MEEYVDSAPIKIYKRRSLHFLSIPALLLGCIGCLFIISAGLRAMGHPNPVIATIASGRYFFVGIGGMIVCLLFFYGIVAGWIRELPQLILSNEGITYKTVWRVRTYRWRSLGAFEKMPYGRYEAIRTRILNSRDKEKREIFCISLLGIEADSNQLLKELNEYRNLALP